MFNRLQRRWKLAGLQLTLVLITFALGGSLTGYAGRKLVNLFAIEQKWLWIVVYIIIIILLWPLAVLLLSIFTGQFRFFREYIKRIGKRIGIAENRKPETRNQKPVHIAIFASGAGSNAQKIIDYFRNSNTVKTALIVCNKPGAGVMNIAAKENIPVILLEKEKFFRGNAYTDELLEKNIAFIVLAGFLWKLPVKLVRDFHHRIINIHPALLPQYGGKGMYGNNVHASVIAQGEKESGITIHYVDDQYDHGDIIFQAKCPVLENDTADSLAQRIHKLEHEHYPRVIEELLAQRQA